jgi:hypothetical protein
MKPQWHTGAGNADKGHSSIIVKRSAHWYSALPRISSVVFSNLSYSGSNLVQGCYSETGFHIGMDRNFVCFMAQTQLQLISPFLHWSLDLWNKLLGF